MNAFLSPVTIYHLIYLAISLALTFWVGRTLFSNGRIFLLESFQNNAEVADAVNQLLLVGFYLLNIGFVTLFLRFGHKPDFGYQILELVSTKIGIVLVVLGVIHFCNIFIFAKLRSRARRQQTITTRPSRPTVQPRRTAA